LSWK